MEQYQGSNNFYGETTDVNTVMVGGARNEMTLRFRIFLPKFEKWYFPVAEDDMAEGETKGDWLPVSCSPPVE